jgi:hypothetical protein
VLEWCEREHEEDNGRKSSTYHSYVEIFWALEILSHPRHEGPSQTIRVPGPYVGPRSVNVLCRGPHIVLIH